MASTNAGPETIDGATGTVGRAPEKKMRTLRVRRAQPVGKSKKQVVLSRKPRPGEELSQPVANLGSPSRTKVRGGERACGRSKEGYTGIRGRRD